MARWFRSFWEWFAPHACRVCEGGSGSIRDRKTGEIRICGACGGTGREREPS